MEQTLKENEEQSHRKILLRFFNINKTYSFNMPLKWTTRRLKNFIYNLFRDETKNNYVQLYYGAKQMTDDSCLVQSHFIESEKDLHQIAILLKPKEETSRVKIDVSMIKLTS